MIKLILGLIIAIGLIAKALEEAAETTGWKETIKIAFKILVATGLIVTAAMLIAFGVAELTGQ